MKVKIQQLDAPNKNHRIYPKEVMQKAIDDFRAKGQPLFGIISEGTEFTGVPLLDVACTVNDLTIEDDYLVGTVKVLSTPKGEVLQDILKDPSSIAFRTAGYGTIHLNDDGTATVGSDYTVSYVSVCPADKAA